MIRVNKELQVKEINIYKKWSFISGSTLSHFSKLNSETLTYPLVAMDVNGFPRKQPLPPNRQRSAPPAGSIQQLHIIRQTAVIVPSSSFNFGAEQIRLEHQSDRAVSSFPCQSLNISTTSYVPMIVLVFTQRTQMNTAVQCSSTLKVLCWPLGNLKYVLISQVLKPLKTTCQIFSV